MSKINLQVVNGVSGSLMVKYDGGQTPMQRNMNHTIRDFDTEKTLELASSDNPNNSRVYRKGYFRSNVMLKCDVRDNELRIEESPM